MRSVLGNILSTNRNLMICPCCFICIFLQWYHQCEIVFVEMNLVGVVGWWWDFCNVDFTIYMAAETRMGWDTTLKVSIGQGAGAWFAMMYHMTSAFGTLGVNVSTGTVGRLCPITWAASAIAPAKLQHYENIYNTLLHKYTYYILHKFYFMSVRSVSTKLTRGFTRYVWLKI